MAGGYKLVVGDREYTHADGVIARIESEERREKHSVCVLSAEFLDPQWDLFGKTPDPAFSNVDVKLYLAKAGEARSQQVLCFDGKVTTLAVGYPDRRALTITAHDKSVDARRNKTLQVFKNKSSAQIAEAMCKVYGWELDTRQVASEIARLVTRRVDLGFNPKLNDWDHMQRALAADGLVAHMRGKKVYVTRAPSVQYGTIFNKDQFPVVSLNVTIQHVRGPGGQGDVKGNVYMDGRGTQQALSGSHAKDAAKEKATARTGRMTVAGASTRSGNIPAIEDIAGNKPEFIVDYLRKRKDAAQLVILSAPDFSLLNNARLQGWGGKVDGTWFAESVKHAIAGDGPAQTTIGLMRGASDAAKKGAVT